MITPLAWAAAAVLPFTSVGPNVRVSSDDLLRTRGQQVEPFLAVSPLDPAALLAGAQEGRTSSGAARALGFYASADGGLTWTRGLVPGLTQASGGPYDRATDPVVAFGPDGTAFYASIALNFAEPLPTSGAVLVSRSSDAGRSWGAPVTVAKAAVRQVLLDEPWLAVDGGAASVRRGAVYVSWAEADPHFMPPRLRVLVARSDDGGLTWGAPSVASAGAHDAAGARLAVGPDGAVHLFYIRRPYTTSGPISTREFLRVGSSTDGGATWSRPVTVATREFPFVTGLRSGPGTAAAVDASTGVLHVAWTDVRRKRGDVVTAHLSPGASRWSHPVRVGDTRSGHVQFTPAVAAAGGAVHLLFYDWAGARRGNVMYTQSIDGGATFRPALRVNSVPFDPRRGVRDFKGRFLADYIGLVATESYAQALWVDTRSASGNDVYTARVSAPSARRP